MSPGLRGPPFALFASCHGDSGCLFILGGFLSDAGWYGDAEKVFLSCLQLCTLHSEVLHCFRAVECCVRSALLGYACLPSSHPLLTSASRKKKGPSFFFSPPPPRFGRLLHVRNGNCKYHLGEETFKLAQSYMDKLAKHGHQANKAALYGELCALLFAKSHYDEVS